MYDAATFALAWDGAKSRSRDRDSSSVRAGGGADSWKGFRVSRLRDSNYNRSIQRQRVGCRSDEKRNAVCN